MTPIERVHAIHDWAEAHWPEIAAFSWLAFGERGRGVVFNDMDAEQQGYCLQANLIGADAFGCDVRAACRAYDPHRQVAAVFRWKNDDGASVGMIKILEFDPTPPQCYLIEGDQLIQEVS